MYTIKYTCNALTGNKIHTLNIKDVSLGDTWAGTNIGEVKGNEIINTAIKTCYGDNVDANVWYDDDDDGVLLSLYTIYLGDDGYVHKNDDDDTSCEIISITFNLEPDENQDRQYEQYTNEGKSFYYPVDIESIENIDCPVCGISCHKDTLVKSDEFIKGEIVGCVECIDEHSKFDVTYDCFDDKHGSMIEMSGYSVNHIKTRFSRIMKYSTIESIDEQ